MNKIRLDKYLVDNNMVSGRDKAAAIIMAGQVYIGEQKAYKAGQLINLSDKITVRGAQKYVSRGGYKLEKALTVFNIDLNGNIAMDVGSSTGGFTDCMLQNGAAQVYAVDVGYNQLDYKMRSHPKVTVMERTNIRYIDVAKLPAFDFITADLSFISLKLVFPIMLQLVKKDGQLVVLVKPQFEAGRENVGKGGIVRDPVVHNQVLHNITNAAMQNGFNVRALDFSPIKGADGNIEFLMHLDKSNEMSTINIEKIVERAHNVE